MSRKQKLSLLAVVLVEIVLLGMVGYAAELAVSAAGDKVMEALWVDLEKPELEASRALLKLADRPKEAVALLKEKMKPLKIRPGEVRARLLKLGSENEETWKAAFEELDYFDPRLAIDLETLMEKITETPSRQRMVALLSDHSVERLKHLDGKKVELRKHGNPGDQYFNFFDGNASWWAEAKVSRLNAVPWGTGRKKWTRAVRAIVLLEHIGTPDAVSIIKEMATGHPEAEPTRVAQETMKRLEKKPG